LLVLAAAQKRTPSSYVSFADTHPACTPANDHHYPYARRLAYARAPGSTLYEEWHPFGNHDVPSNRTAAKNFLPPPLALLYRRDHELLQASL
jgi:hypothetical protein